MKAVRLLKLLVCSLFALTSTLHAQFDDMVLAKPSLHLESANIEPGKPFTIGVRLLIEPGWHTYWQFGGDSGLPIGVEWELPQGFHAGPIQWPLPTAYPAEGDQLTYVYNSEVLLLVQITAPTPLPPNPQKLKAKLNWLTCKETCIPGKGEAVISTDATPEPDLIAKWRAQLPKATPPPFGANWDITAKQIKVTLTDIAADVKVEFFPIPPEASIEVGHPLFAPSSADGRRTVTAKIESATPPNAGPWRALVTIQKPGSNSREGWEISSATQTAQPAAPAPTTAAIPQGVTASSPPAPARGLAGVLWAAFLGGIILNLMPCVLPVIALKIFGFVQQAGEAPQRVFRLGLAFVAGVFAFFLGLAALVVIFQSAGNGLTWGFQFQNPIILVILTALVLLFAQSMFGVFEITLGSDASTKLDELSRKDGYAGAFAHGVFTTLLGTSCTAPLLGPVLGFAFAQKPAIVFTVFTAIAAGMSLPYFLLTWKPAWMRFLPKPGAWMERLKHFLGFILLGVVVWLLGVFGYTHGVEGMTGLAAFLLLLALAAWIYGTLQKPLSYILAALALAAGWTFFLKDALNSDAPDSPALTATQKEAIPWEPYTAEAVEAALSEGAPVFIDFTAKWCANCIYNEKTILETQDIRGALRERKVRTFKADWTKRDKAITDAIGKLGRVGVPVYALYPGRGVREPVVLPEILTKGLLLEELSKVHAQP